MAKLTQFKALPVISHVSSSSRGLDNTRSNRPAAHSYQYSFAPNPNWSDLYAPGSEIQQYLQDVAERFGATRFIKTRHNVEHCEWDDVQKKW